MISFRVVPDNLRGQDDAGRPIRKALSKALLGGHTVFIPNCRQRWGSLYTLAKNHKKRARIRTISLNEETGQLIWFEDYSEAT